MVAEGEIKEVYEAEVQVVGSKEKEVDEGEQELVKTEELNKNKEPLMNNTTFKEKEFSLPPEHADKMKSSQYFKRFWDNNVSEHLAQHTNLCSVQELWKSIDTNQKEIKILFGIQINSL